MIERPINLPLATPSTPNAESAGIEASFRDYGATLLALTDAEVAALDALLKESRQFFELEHEIKNKYAPGSPSEWDGYMPSYSTVDEGSEPDDFERIQLGRGSSARPQVAALACDRPHLYELANYVLDILLSKCRQCNQMVSSIIGVDPITTDRVWFDEHSSKLSINYYPRSTASAVAPHRDFAGISLIYAGNDPSSLQLSEPNSDRWSSIAGASSSTLFALLGELYSYWIGGIWPAAFHRVANPIPGRISIVLFHQPNRGSELSTVIGDNPEVQVGQFLAELEKRYVRTTPCD
jgi:isopenicillin N synthase-like dioxygenase